MGITIFNVADYFLNRVETEQGSSITHLKLQKLCYYAQAWYLAFEGKNYSVKDLRHGYMAQSIQIYFKNTVTIHGRTYRR